MKYSETRMRLAFFMARIRKFGCFISKTFWWRLQVLHYLCTVNRRLGDRFSGRQGIFNETVIQQAKISNEKIHVSRLYHAYVAEYRCNGKNTCRVLQLHQLQP
jgi:hypothetical protein